MGIVRKIDALLDKDKKNRPWLSIQLGYSSTYIDGLFNGHFGPSIERAKEIINFIFKDSSEEEKNKLTIELMEIEKKKRSV